MMRSNTAIAVVGVPQPKAARRPAGRRRLWELDQSYLCSIVGTCLSIPELKRIARKLRLHFEESALGYSYHGYFVKQAQTDCPASRFMHKALDRKYRTSIARATRLQRPGELFDFWRDELEEGNVPGPFWAVATHPAATDALLKEVFAEVHMLSHLAGASNRADIRRLRQLERDAEANGQRVLEQAQRHRAAIAARDREIERLKARLIELETQRPAGRSDEGSVRAESVRTERERRWTGRVAHLEAALSDAEAALTSSEERADELRHRLDAATSRAERAEAERFALEWALGDRLDAEAAPFDLGERRVALVGGRPTAVARLRALVERHNGCWLHHDGGEEDALAQLPGVLKACDAVICPVDSVSHRACLEAKAICKRGHRPFLPIRGTGLATFTRALREIAEPSRTCVPDDKKPCHPRAGIR